MMASAAGNTPDSSGRAATERTSFSSLDRVRVGQDFAALQAVTTYSMKFCKLVIRSIHVINKYIDYIEMPEDTEMLTMKILSKTLFLYTEKNKKKLFPT